MYRHSKNPSAAQCIKSMTKVDNTFLPSPFPFLIPFLWPSNCLFNLGVLVQEFRQSMTRPVKTLLLGSTDLDGSHPSEFYAPLLLFVRPSTTCSLCLDVQVAWEVSALCLDAQYVWEPGSSPSACLGLAAQHWPASSNCCIWDAEVAFGMLTPNPRLCLDFNAHWLATSDCCTLAGNR